jgi:hypothetical protein
LPDTFQLLAVSPALETGGFWKVTTVESNVKSPWNPTRLSAALIAEVTTGLVKSVTDVSMLSVGKETVATRIGVGVGANGSIRPVASAVGLVSARLSRAAAAHRVLFKLRGLGEKPETGLRPAAAGDRRLERRTMGLR